jgi:hypothetical protein
MSHVTLDDGGARPLNLVLSCPISRCSNVWSNAGSQAPSYESQVLWIGRTTVTMHESGVPLCAPAFTLGVVYLHRTPRPSLLTVFVIISHNNLPDGSWNFWWCVRARGV